MKGIQFTVVDAFVTSGKVFTGNPAAVVVLEKDSDISDDNKQRIAAEFNLSETCFVSKVADTETFLIRWFTPTKEVPLCGHATLATSFVLFKNHLPDNVRVIEYVTHFGDSLKCARDSSSLESMLTLNFPLNAPFQLFPTMNKWLPDLCRAVLGPEISQKVIDHQISTGTKKLLLRLADELPEETLTSVAPDFRLMKGIDTGGQVLGVVVTQKSNFSESNLHFRSRYFAPWAGIDEDPVTGSSFTVLTPYWKKAYLDEHNQSIEVFHAAQVSSRGGSVLSRIDDERVHISGSAVQFSTGFIEF